MAEPLYDQFSAPNVHERTFVASDISYSDHLEGEFDQMGAHLIELIDLDRLMLGTDLSPSTN